jgi:hypothetical protein
MRNSLNPVSDPADSEEPKDLSSTDLSNMPKFTDNADGGHLGPVGNLAGSFSAFALRIVSTTLQRCS